MMLVQKQFGKALLLLLCGMALPLHAALDYALVQGA